jgi:hypothetical protein
MRTRENPHRLAFSKPFPLPNTFAFHLHLLALPPTHDGNCPGFLPSSLSSIHLAIALN